jgi:hypothetical protein
MRMPGAALPGARLASLAAVATVSPDLAWAVGKVSYSRGTSRVLIEGWNGARWTVVG